MIDVLTKDFQQDDLKELDEKGFEDYKKLNIYLSSDKKISMIPLTYDKMFKALFVKCQDEFKDFLIETLNLDLRTEDITINILNNEVAIDNYNEIKKIADLFIKINDNILLNIEVNRKSYNDVKLRNNRYIGKLIDGQIYSESDYKKLNDVLIIQLNINSAEKSKEGKEKEIVMYDKKSCKIFSENLKIFLKYAQKLQGIIL